MKINQASTINIYFVCLSLTLLSYAASGEELPETESLIAKIDYLAKEVAQLKKQVIPPNAVLAFNRETCPAEWRKYKKAYGRFIRGIDIDSQAKRAPGDPQDDALQGHEIGFDKNFSVNFLKDLRWSPALLNQGIDNGFARLQIAGVGRAGSPLGGDSSRRSERVSQLQGKLVNADSFGNLRVDNETRPKNVALLFCIKK